ncbi:MAG: hypothetical protein HY717_01675 [Planctomycetes bacterium]|nr:hypothetical protein [Planctomycetota bacterium]
MTTAVLLAELSRAGVRLAAAGERIRLDAPRGVLTPELRNLLAEHKTEILEALRRVAYPLACPTCGRRLVLIAGRPPDCPGCRLEGRPVPILPAWVPPPGPRPDPARAEVCRLEAEAWKAKRLEWLRRLGLTPKDAGKEPERGKP